MGDWKRFASRSALLGPFGAPAGVPEVDVCIGGGQEGVRAQHCRGRSALRRFGKLCACMIDFDILVYLG